MTTMTTAFMSFLANKARYDTIFGGIPAAGRDNKLLSQLSIYECGKHGTIPMEWSEYKKQFDRDNDPEFEIYQRLKKKFE